MDVKTLLAKQSAQLADAYETLAFQCFLEEVGFPLISMVAMAGAVPWMLLMVISRVAKSSPYRRIKRISVVIGAIAVLLLAGSLAMQDHKARAIEARHASKIRVVAKLQASVTERGSLRCYTPIRYETNRRGPLIGTYGFWPFMFLGAVGWPAFILYVPLALAVWAWRGNGGTPSGPSKP